MQHTNNTSTTRRAVFIGTFAAIAFVLQYFGGMIPKVSGFLEIEFSDLPALLLTFAYGPVAGVLCELIKNLLHMFISTTALVGEFANFVINGSMCFVAGLIYRKHKTYRGALASLACGTVFMVLFGVLVNLFVMLPMYIPTAPLNAKLQLVMFTIVPTNLVRGTVLSVLCLVLYKRISPFLHKS